MISSESHQLFRDLYGAARRIVLATHIQPDGDALGSEFSVARFLKSEGKQVRIINHDPTAEILQFIASPELPVEVYDPAKHDEIVREADLVILLDNSAPDRLGRMEPVMTAAAPKVLCIDHHPARDAPWKHNIVDVGACATAAIVYELFEEIGWTPDLEAATALYVGIATDTGFFRFNSANARGYRTAADLLDLGVEPAATFRAIYERNSEAYTRLLGHALVDLKLDAGGTVASVQLTRELIMRLSASDVDTSEITSSLLAIDGVRIVVLCRELSGDEVKVSLRSKGELDMHHLAGEFGGGGHRNASGIVMPGTLEQAAATVIDRATSLLAKQS